MLSSETVISMDKCDMLIKLTMDGKQNNYRMLSPAYYPAEHFGRKPLTCKDFYTPSEISKWIGAYAHLDPNPNKHAHETACWEKDKRRWMIFPSNEDPVEGIIKLVHPGYNEKEYDRMCASYVDIEEALDYAKEIEMMTLNRNEWERAHANPIFHALVLSMVVAFGRPFTRKEDRDGKREKGIYDPCIPEGYEDIHEFLKSIRNGIYAHSDIKGEGISYSIDRVGISYSRYCPSDWVKGKGKIDEVLGLLLALKSAILNNMKCLQYTERRDARC